MRVFTGFRWGREGVLVREGEGAVEGRMGEGGRDEGWDHGVERWGG